jgi:uncharacterized damage-inducible protein DinB
MIRTIADFDRMWQAELEATQKIFKHLTNASLAQFVSPDDRTLGRLAWHITTSIPEMMQRTGLKIEEPSSDAPVPATAKEIFNAYNSAAASMLQQITNSWTDATLLQKDEMYGEQWERGFTLQVLIHHQIHHRGQMTVLMRQAGLSVPGIFGPSREEWSAFGMQPPAV